MPAAVARRVLFPPLDHDARAGHTGFSIIGGVMRVLICAVAAAIGLAVHPAFAQSDQSPAAFWKSVQATCDATAAKPAGALGQRIAQNAINEFNTFGGHEIDSNGRIFRFGLTEAEHEEDDGGAPKANLGKLGWWQVMNYWRALYGDKAPEMLEARGYQDASSAADGAQSAAKIDTSAADLLRAADAATDPEIREILREAALRAAITDTSWSAAFISYVVRQAGVTPDAFQFANAHRAYIYQAFATSAAEVSKQPADTVYRACPLSTTRPRVGDLICTQRESTLSKASDAEVRERIRTELANGGETRTIRRTHCEVVASIDAKARKMYTIGGNVNQAVTARKLNLRHDLKFSAVQKGHCGGVGSWTLPGASAEAAEKCSLNDKKWFVLLQAR